MICWNMQIFLLELLFLKTNQLVILGFFLWFLYLFLIYWNHMFGNVITTHRSRNDVTPCALISPNITFTDTIDPSTLDFR